MPRVARYVAITDSDVPITLPTEPHDEAFFGPFAAPGVVTRSQPVLFFQVNPVGSAPVMLRVELNGTTLVNINFTGPAQRSWHEIAPAGLLQPEGNQIVVGVSGEGRVSFSDFVLLYQANVGVALGDEVDPPDEQVAATLRRGGR